MTAESLSLLARLAEGAGIALRPGALELFGKFGDFLIERNRQFNLTAVDDERGVVVKHFLDSLSCAAYISDLTTRGAAHIGDLTTRGAAHIDGLPAIAAPVSLVDVGTGAGFPGIPLKIMFGGALNVTFIDSTAKKINFVKEAVEALRLGGCEAVHARAEEAAKHAGMRGRYNAATARAVSTLPKLVEYCLPLLAPGGALIAMKGRREAAEIEIAQSAQALRRFNGKIRHTACFKLPAAPAVFPSTPPSAPPDSPPALPPALPASPAYYERTLVIVEKLG